MKKFVLFAAVVFGLSTMNAQKNSILFGGNVGYSHTENKLGGNTQKMDTYEYSPYLGYQFADNWTIGAKATLTKADLSQEALAALGLNDGNTKTRQVGGFIRYTRPLNETFSFYADLGAGWQETETKGRLGNQVGKSKADGYYIGFTPALFINFKNNFGLNFSIGGVEYSELKQGGRKASDIDVTFGNAFNIGVSKNFKL